MLWFSKDHPSQEYTDGNLLPANMANRCIDVAISLFFGVPRAPRANTGLISKQKMFRVSRLDARFETDDDPAYARAMIMVACSHGRLVVAAEWCLWRISILVPRYTPSPEGSSCHRPQTGLQTCHQLLPQTLQSRGQPCYRLNILVTGIIAVAWRRRAVCPLPVPPRERSPR